MKPFTRLQLLTKSIHGKQIKNYITLKHVSSWNKKR